jgi:hypothetical protein
MEAELRSDRIRFGIRLISLVFGLFSMATTAHAQILGLGAPNIGVQPMGTNVQNGDTITLTTAATCESLAQIPSVTWLFKNGTLPTNAVVTYTGLGSDSVTSTLTLTHVSSADVGDFSVDIEDELLGGVLGITTAMAYSQNAPLSLIPVVTADAGSPSGTGMTTKGFKIQFSAPTGSNLVIQASTDMIHWTPVWTNVVTAGSVTYTDITAKTVPGRFYRARLK